jgi:integrase/recombinase XerD
MPRDMSNASTPILDWPQSDREAWTRALLPPDPFNPLAAYANRWKPATRQALTRSYGQWITWLRKTGRLDPTSPPADRATRETVRAYFDHMVERGLADLTVSTHVARLGDMLKAMHPDQDWFWLDRAAGRLANIAKPKRDKRSTTQPTEQLLALGEALIAAAETADPSSRQEAPRLARDGLIIALLALRPFRKRNLTALTLGRHVEKRDGRWLIRIEAEETKNGRQIYCDWPEQLVEPLERYIAVHRRILLGEKAKIMGDLGPLWISHHGNQITGESIWSIVRSRTERGLGVALNLHSFRHSAATTIATHDPENASSIADVLGHSTLRTADRYYNQAQMITAGDVYGQTIVDLRSGRRKQSS